MNREEPVEGALRSFIEWTGGQLLVMFTYHAAWAGATWLAGSRPGAAGIGEFMRASDAPAAAPHNLREGRILGVERRFLLFLAVGGLNTLFGYGLFAALVASGLPIAVAMLFSTIGGVLFNFRTTGALVFANRDGQRLVRFVAVYALLYGANLAGLEALMAIGLPVYPASAMLILPMALLGYGLNRAFVFREPA